MKSLITFRRYDVLDNGPRAALFADVLEDLEDGALTRDDLALLFDMIDVGLRQLEDLELLNDENSDRIEELEAQVEDLTADLASADARRAGLEEELERAAARIEFLTDALADARERLAE